jgi:hypothetical protein
VIRRTHLLARSADAIDRAIRHPIRALTLLRPAAPAPARVHLAEPHPSAVQPVGLPIPAGALDGYALAPYTHLIDVGGYADGLLLHLLRRHPTLRGIHLVDPARADAIRRRLAIAGVADRSAVITGSGFERVPGGGDLYLLARALQPWDDGANLRLLRSCVRAMPSRGRLLLLEDLRPSSGVPGRGMACRGRTEAQVAALLAVAGLTIVDITRAGGALHIIEAAPAC